MSSKKLKYSNNCNRESGVHFDPPYTTGIITALKLIFRWPPMETAVLRAQNRAHPVVREKHHTKHREKRLWLIDVLPMRPQRTDLSLWRRRVQPIREWQSIYSGFQLYFEHDVKLFFQKNVKWNVLLAIFQILVLCRLQFQSMQLSLPGFQIIPRIVKRAGKKPDIGWFLYRVFGVVVGRRNDR